MRTIFDKQPIGRLALRVEGDFWVAYWARAETMEGAVALGSLSFTLAQIPERKKAFMQLMQDAFGDMVEEAFGSRPVWSRPTSAPDHERSSE